MDIDGIFTRSILDGDFNNFSLLVSMGLSTYQLRIQFFERYLRLAIVFSHIALRWLVIKDPKMEVR